MKLKSLLLFIVLSTQLFSIEFEEINLYNIHTKEKISIFYQNEKLYPNQEKKISKFLRDWRKNESVLHETKLFNNLYKILKKTNNLNKKIDVICGYRNSKTNKQLQKRSKNKEVAEKSHHTLGKAIDFSIRKTNMKKVFNQIKRMKLGGVGYYTKNNFIHIDTGRVRFWTGT